MKDEDVNIAEYKVLDLFCGAGDLGLDKFILIYAAPGTGKTVIAIYRVYELSDAV